MLTEHFASLDKIKPSVKSWWTAGAQAPQLLASGELSVAAAWSGRVLAAKTQKDLPENVEYNQALIYADSWVVAKGSPNKDLAMKFINFCTTAEIRAVSKLVDDAPTNSNALPLLSEELKTRLGQSTSSAKQIVADVKWWADNYETVDERFQKWLLK